MNWRIPLADIDFGPEEAAAVQAVVASKRLPENIRQAINVESGLNDGIALPPILMCLAALSGA